MLAVLAESSGRGRNCSVRLVGSRSRLRCRGHPSRPRKSPGDEFVLNGEKTWISNGGIADFYCVFARTGEQPGSRGLSAFIVEGSNPGLEITERIETMAPHPLARISFKDCHVTAKARLGGPGEGFKIAMATLDVFRTTVGCSSTRILAQGA